MLHKFQKNKHVWPEMFVTNQIICLLTKISIWLLLYQNQRQLHEKNGVKVEVTDRHGQRGPDWDNNNQCPCLWSLGTPHWGQIWTIWTNDKWFIANKTMFTVSKLVYLPFKYRKGFIIYSFWLTQMVLTIKCLVKSW